MPELSNTQLFLALCAMIALELNHLKWIWWTQWECSKCRRKHEDCACGDTKWVMYL